MARLAKNISQMFQNWDTWVKWKGSNSWDMVYTFSMYIYIYIGTYCIYILQVYTGICTVYGDIQVCTVYTTINVYIYWGSKWWIPRPICTSAYTYIPIYTVHSIHNSIGFESSPTPSCRGHLIPVRAERDPLVFCGCIGLQARLRDWWALFSLDRIADIVFLLDDEFQRKCLHRPPHFRHWIIYSRKIMLFSSWLPISNVL